MANQLIEVSMGLMLAELIYCQIVKCINSYPDVVSCRIHYIITNSSYRHSKFLPHCLG